MISARITARHSRIIALIMSCCVAATASAQSEGGEGCRLSPAEIYKQKSDAVTSIGVTTITPYRLQNRVQRGVGSGFVFNRAGEVLTNSHVVFGAAFIQVTLDDGAVYPAKVVGIDPIFDIAILKILNADPNKLPYLPLGKSSKVSVGQEVVAIGNPLGLSQTLTTGVISALDRVLAETPLSLSRRLIQTDAALNPGNSGGPLLNLCGEVVGINTSIIQGAQNVGFAIPIDLVKETLPQLTKRGRIIRPWVGFHGQIITDEIALLVRVPLSPGLLVEVVEPGSPAEKKGIRGGALDLSIGGHEFILGGDIIKSVNSIALTDPVALGRAMRALAVGSKMRLRVLRDGKEFSVTYSLPERPLLPGDIPN